MNTVNVGGKRLVSKEELELYSYVDENASLVVDEMAELISSGLQTGDGGLLFAYGPVYSGKTLAACMVIDRLHRKDLRVMAIQPEVGRPDVPTDKYFSRSGVEKKVESVSDKKKISKIFDKSDVVIIDEIQFFPSEVQSFLLKVIQDYVDRGGWVVAMGMLYTSQRSEFLLSAVLKDRCFKSYALTATCLKCGKRGAMYNQRIVKGLPTTIEDPELISPSEEVIYEPRCSKCHVIIG
ncbi:MAG: thymidine kinase [Candidatus Microgenomates bacterium]